MSKHLRIHVSCPDDRGLLAAIASRVFDLGGDLGDASFALLGEQAEMTCVAGFPDNVTEEQVRDALCGLHAVKQGDVTVKPFRLGRAHVSNGTATHVVRVHGVDRPGLMARLAECFGEMDANVVRMDAEHAERELGTDYKMRFEVHIPPERVEACLANVSNTAAAMGLHCHAEEADVD
ncbi:MAG: amino acid-binding protein [Myxococcota bacterium]|nr:amino acid-binding protein [Myxococcota bacterium]